MKLILKEWLGMFNNDNITDKVSNAENAEHFVM